MTTTLPAPVEAEPPVIVACDAHGGPMARHLVETRTFDNSTPPNYSMMLAYICVDWRSCGRLARANRVGIFA